MKIEIRYEKSNLNTIVDWVSKNDSRFEALSINEVKDKIVERAVEFAKETFGEAETTEEHVAQLPTAFKSIYRSIAVGFHVEQGDSANYALANFYLRLRNENDNRETQSLYPIYRTD